MKTDTTCRPGAATDLSPFSMDISSRTPRPKKARVGGMRVGGIWDELEEVMVRRAYSPRPMP